MEKNGGKCKIPERNKRAEGCKEHIWMGYLIEDMFPHNCPFVQNSCLMP